MFFLRKPPRPAPQPVDWDAVAHGMHTLADDIKNNRHEAREWLNVLNEGFANEPDWWADYPTESRAA